MELRRSAGASWTILLITIALTLCSAVIAHAQTADHNQLRSTIYAQVMSDPRSKDLSQAQVYALVNALAQQAQAQNVTSSQITYRPQAPEAQSTLTACNDVMCSFSRAFGLDGTFLLIPLTLLILAIMFIFLYSHMREMGHPHAQG